MNFKVRSVLCVLAIAAVVVTSSCSAVVGTLNGIVDGAAVLEPTVAADAAAGLIPTAIAANIIDYLEATSTAASNSITEWESSDSESAKIAAITANFADVAAPSLGPGVSLAIETSIQSIGTLISELIEQIGAAQSANTKSRVMSIHVFDKQELNRVKGKAVKTVAAAEAWKAQQRMKAALK